LVKQGGGENHMLAKRRAEKNANYTAKNTGEGLLWW
jgi:hypothetical protein